MPEAERQPQVQPVAPAPAATPAGPSALVAPPRHDPAGLVGALAAGSEDWRAEVVNGIQRTSGNRAVLRMLARDTVDAPAKPQETGIADSAATGRMSAAAKQLVKDWDTLKSADDRAQKLAAQPLAELQAAGVPAYKVVLKNTGGNNGQFDFQTWTMELNKPRFEVTKPTAEQISGLARTISHESRHAEQWFRMARLEAGRGKNAAEIASKLFIKDTAAAAAEKNKLMPGSAEATEAQAWFESVYGAKAADRNKILNDLTALDTKLAAAKTTGDAQKIADAQKAVDENYAKYKALPEEADAWKVGETVESGVKKP